MGGRRFTRRWLAAASRSVRGTVLGPRHDGNFSLLAYSWKDFCRGTDAFRAAERMHRSDGDD